MNMFPSIAKMTQLTNILLADFGLSDANIKHVVFSLVILLGVVFFLVGRVISNWLLGLFLTQASKRDLKERQLLSSLGQYKVAHHMANLIPVILLGLIIPLFRVDFPELLPKVIAVLDTIFLWFVLRLLGAVLKGMCHFLKTLDSYRDKPLESYAQIIMLVLYFIALAFLYVKFTDKSITGFFGTLGAISAVLMLIFKDTILGIVASIQVAMNDMVRIGDWVTMKSCGADGYVIEINLTTVKVRNFDNTVTTIPTYTLISGSFQNWRSMYESGNRQIQRSIIIKPSTIKFLTPEDVERMKSIQLITQYLQERQTDIETSNLKNNVNKELMVNGRNLTNFGVFRKYIATYLAHNSAINQENAPIIRALQPTEYGYPIEVYAYVKDTRWANYEYIQAAIFDHITAAASYFDLEVCELTS